MAEKKKRRRYASYYWLDPKTKLGYCKVQIPTGETFENGKPKYKTIKKRADNPTHADQLASEIFDDYNSRKNTFLAGESMTFGELARWYKAHRACPPKYSPDGTKVAGMRTFETVRNRIIRIEKFFDDTLLKDITEYDLENLKKFIFREAKKEKAGDTPTDATINRYLEDARAMFRVAVRERWIKESPFDYGERLIEKSLEKQREVTITEDQEKVLLHFAKKSEKTNIYHVLLCLLDTGARPSEIYDASTVEGEPITWKDFFDYDFNAVRLTSFKGRQKKVRIAPVTKRLNDAMTELWNSLKAQNVEAKIFPVKSFKTTWRTIRREAALIFAIAEKLETSIDSLLNENFDKEIIEKTRKEIIKEKNEQSFIETVRLRDLRRNFSTKLAKKGIESHIRQRILGHELESTTFDYTQADLAAVLAIKDVLDDSMN